jgi:hypothetical protein
MAQIALEVGKSYLHTNEYGDKLVVEFRGKLDWETAIVFHRKSGGQYSCKLSELSEVQE